MFELLGITPQGLVAQLLVGLINGSFYAILSLGLAIIFGLLNIINFAHGAQYTMGAFIAWIGLTQISQWLGFVNIVSLTIINPDGFNDFIDFMIFHILGYGFQIQ